MRPTTIWRLGLSILLLVVIISSTCDTSIVPLWGVTFLVSLTTVLWRWFRRRGAPRPYLLLCALVYIGASVALTRHALATVDVLPVPDPIKASPDLTRFYLAVHFGLIIWLLPGELLPSALRLPVVWPALFLYASHLYLGTFFAAEQGSPYAPIYALVIARALLRLEPPIDIARLSASTRALRISLLAFLVLLGIAVFLSPDPSESLKQYLQIAAFALLPFLLVGDVSDRHAWRLAARWVVILNGVVLGALAAVKLGLLVGNLGLVPALHHRLFIADIGPNGISRNLVTLFPLGVSLVLTASDRRRKLLWGTAIVGMLLTIVYTQSNRGFGGWLALVLGVGTMVLLLRWPTVEMWWKSHPQAHNLIAALSAGLIVAALLLGGWLAAQMNTYSFNGRLYVWRAALYQTADRPLFGSGPGVRYRASQYGARVLWENMGARSQWFVDNPLSQSWQKRQTIIHTHNLFLEVAVAAGMPALLAFLWFLWELGKHSLTTLRQASGQSRVLLAGCIAGIAGTLGWGLLDVVEFSPPFFTTPTWVLVGLLLAAPRALNVDAGRRAEEGYSSCVTRHSSFAISHVSRFTFRASRFTQRAIPTTLLFFLACVAVVVPLFGNSHYRTGYTAFQERHWATAAGELARASRWEPLNAKYQELRGKALINLGQYGEAISAYERAVRLKRGFAPWHAQLGWLHWLQGDLERAATHFEKAVEMDPREAWRDGLHADLGLAYVAQGRFEEAIPLFKETIELDPQMALAPYWVPVQGEDGEVDVVLDSVYLGEPSSELDKRILTHLGKADHTRRLFDLEASAGGPISLSQVLDAIEADYLAARTAKSRDAPRLLATIAEAARIAGLHERAAHTYLAFQQTYPESVYGFRDLGALYREQGHLEEAQRSLEQAVGVSPQDTDSWIRLAEVHLERGLWQEAEQALDTVYRLAPLDSRLYVLRARLSRQQGNLAQAADNLHRALVIEESVPNRLTLAGLYRQSQQSQQATEQCAQVVDVLRRSWVRPLDPELQESGVCLAQTVKDSLPTEVAALAHERPAIGNVLLGHFHRARGQLDHALEAYQRAAGTCPDESAPHYFLGEAYQALGQMVSAEAEYHQAAQLDPLESLPLLALGQLQWARGEQTSALESFRAAVEITPGWERAHTMLGNALLATGDTTGAADYFRRAQLANGEVHEGTVYDFVAHLAYADIESPGSDYVKNDYFDINGDGQRTLFTHPDSRVRYVVEVPKGAVLAFSVGTAPESWEQPGDGVTFAVYVKPDQDAQPFDRFETWQVFSIYIDPKRNEGSRRWHPHQVDLSAFGGKTVDIIFTTSSGPAGDARYDWAGWGTPRLVQRQVGWLHSESFRQVTR